MIGIIGSVNLDNTTFLDYFPKVGETVRGLDFFITLGGKGVNQAIAAAKSGHTSVYFFGKANKEHDLRFVKKTLRDNGVKSMFVQGSKEPTGNAYILISKQLNDNKIIVNPLANFDFNKRDQTKVKEFINQNKYIIFQNEISQEFTEFCLKYAYSKKKIIIFNPSPVASFKNEWMKYITYLVPNETELEALINKTNIKDLESACKILHKKGAKNILVTLGSKGSYFYPKRIYSKVQKQKVVDPTAAGDTFVGAFVSQLSSGASEEEAINFAHIASSIAVTKKGASMSIPSFVEINDFFEKQK